MAENYEVQQGDCISSIAFEKGFFPDTIWNHPNNRELKSERKNGNVLLVGDSVFVPDKRPKEESKSTNQVHKFRLKNTPAQLRIQLMESGKPKAGLPYTLDVDGRPVSKPGDRTDSRGFVVCPIPPDAKAGKLTLIDGENTIEYDLQLGHLGPVDEISGVKQRLHNLGYYDGPLNGAIDEELKQAISDYQEDAGQTPTGKLDQSLKDMLQSKHDLT